MSGELQFIDDASNHYKFAGKERDAETGLDYFGARLYSNGLSRFLTPVGKWPPENPRDKGLADKLIGR